jgi:hypothetical protein
MALSPGPYMALLVSPDMALSKKELTVGHYMALTVDPYMTLRINSRF